jgi:hypothetical protein
MFTKIKSGKIYFSHVPVMLVIIALHMTVILLGSCHVGTVLTLGMLVKWNAQCETDLFGTLIIQVVAHCPQSEDGHGE